MAERQRGTTPLREATEADLQRQLDEAYLEMFRLRMRHATRQLENHQAIGRVRKQIARIKTIQTERRLGIQRG